MPCRMATVVAKICTILFWNMENISISLVGGPFAVAGAQDKHAPSPSEAISGRVPWPAPEAIGHRLGCGRECHGGCLWCCSGGAKGRANAAIRHVHLPFPEHRSGCGRMPGDESRWTVPFRGETPACRGWASRHPGRSGDWRDWSVVNRPWSRIEHGPH
jgi:hypothetical protein